MPALYSHTTRANGTVLTATIYNGDHQNHIDNGVPAQLDDFSVNVGQMQSQVSPGGVGTESLPSNLSGELERLRYVIAQMKGTAFWYDPGTQSNALIGVRVITSTGTYTPTTGTRSVVVDLIGGGGGGGGAPAPAAGQISMGGGGASGARSISRITSAFSGVTVTIGGGGAGNNGAAGSAGGNSSFGGLMSANGGGGGNIAGPAAPNFVVTGGSAGPASGGSIANISGHPGHPGIGVGLAGGTVIGGNGANGAYGSGGLGPQANSGTAAAGLGFGAGGAGASSLPGSGPYTGGAGAPGVCIIYEYA